MEEAEKIYIILNCEKVFFPPFYSYHYIHKMGMFLDFFYLNVFM